MPLSEEEQRILHEMEQKLYEHDRAFVDRVRAEGPGSVARRSARWSAAVFLAGFAVLLVSFRSSLLLGTFGFLVMVLAALLFERSAHQAYGKGAREGSAPARGRSLAGEVATIGRRLRSRPRFRRDH